MRTCLMENYFAGWTVGFLDSNLSLFLQFLIPTNAVQVQSLLSELVYRDNEINNLIQDLTNTWKTHNYTLRL